MMRAAEWTPATLTADADLQVYGDSVDQFAGERLGPLVEQCETSDTLPNAMTSELQRGGHLRLGLPLERGGAGANLEAVAITVQRISKVSPVAGVVLLSIDHAYRNLISAGAGTGLIDEVGVLPIVVDCRDPLTSIEVIPSGNRWVVSGFARRVEGCFEASSFVIIHPKAGVLVIESGRAQLGEKLERTGLRGWAPGSVTFDQVSGRLVGPVNFETEGIIDERLLLLGVVSSGIAERALDDAYQYSVNRRQFGVSLVVVPAVRAILEQMRDETLTITCSIFAAVCDVVTLGKTSEIRSSNVARRASRAALHVSERAIQVHGGYGYLEEYSVARFFRDAVTVGALAVRDGNS